MRGNLVRHCCIWSSLTDFVLLQEQAPSLARKVIGSCMETKRIKITLLNFNMNSWNKVQITGNYETTVHSSASSVDWSLLFPPSSRLSSVGVYYVFYPQLFFCEHLTRLEKNKKFNCRSESIYDCQQTKTQSEIGLTPKTSLLLFKEYVNRKFPILEM